MTEEEEKSPILGSWKNVYWLLVIVLVAVIIGLLVITNKYS